MSEETYKGYTIKIERDDYPQNPRENDNIGKMVCFHRRYSLGDEHDHKSEEFNGWDEFEKHLIEDHQAVVILPLYLYDHSGITMKTSPFDCRWDSGQVGFIYADRETIKKEYGNLTKASKAKAEKYIRCEVESYDKYIRGDIVGFVVEKDGDRVESCWGFEDYEYALEEAKSMVDCDIENRRKEKQRKLKIISA